MRAPCLSGMCKICTNHKIVCFNPKDCENACRTSQVLVQLYVSRLLYVMRLHTSSAQGHLPSSLAYTGSSIAAIPRKSEQVHSLRRSDTWRIFGVMDEMCWNTEECLKSIHERLIIWR